VLAGLLTDYRGRDDVVVLGLPRGGIPVGWEVAADLRAPLDVFLVRKLGVPNWSELAMGAIASGGEVVLNEDVMRSLRISPEQLKEIIGRETEELHRREAAYRGDRGRVDLHAKIVIVVDDGIATGASMKVAVRGIRSAGPAGIVVAVPVGPRPVCRQLATEVDDVYCAATPAHFDAVGQVYDDFHQVSDDEVRKALAVPTTESG
jgi:putative phosphoribosyl transferase